MTLQQLEKIQSLDTNITALKLMRDLQKDLGMVEAEKQTRRCYLISMSTVKNA